MDHLVNLIIVLLPLALVIGRAITNARNKHKTNRAPAAEQAREEEYTPRIFSQGVFESFNELINPEEKKAAPAPAPAPVILKSPAKVNDKPLSDQKILTSSLETSLITPEEKTSTVVSVKKTPLTQPAKTVSVQGDFFSNINHLSPLKQAVIMSEVLGLPVGIRG